MVEAITVYRDSKGGTHPTRNAAIRSELAIVTNGNAGMALELIRNRDAVMSLLDQLEAEDASNITIA